MSFKLLANVDNRIDLLRLIVELKSLKRYKNEFSLAFDTLLGRNVKNDNDFRVVGAILSIGFVLFCLGIYFRM